MASLLFSDLPSPPVNPPDLASSVFPQIEPLDASQVEKSYEVYAGSAYSSGSSMSLTSADNCPASVSRHQSRRWSHGNSDMQLRRKMTRSKSLPTRTRSMTSNEIQVRKTE